MRLFVSILCFVATSVATAAQARPVSYPDGWTLMVRNDARMNSLHAHYTLDTRHSLGLRMRYDRERDFVFAGPQFNRLLKRWNQPDSQANLYLRSAVGIAFDEGGPRDDDAAFFLGASADWETRRWFTEAAVEYWDAGEYGDWSSWHGRVGVAPYIANTGALHTWFMIEVHNRPEDKNNTGATALVRFFKGPSLIELGVDDDGEPMLNYIHRF